jgi:hypothetical protein
VWSFSERSNWNLMLIYTFVLIVGIIIGAFVVAFYWSIDFIDRIDPITADYSAEYSAIVFPLNSAIIEAVQLAYKEENIYQENEYLFEVTPTPILEPSSTPTTAPSLTPTPDFTNTATKTQAPSSTPTESETRSSTSTSTPTHTATYVVVTLTSTPKKTKSPGPKPTEPKPTEPRPTIPQPKPSATQQPTKPPRPTNTKDPYPYP